MGIRPADMQMIVHKTQEIHPAKQSVVSKQDNDLVNTQIENKAETEKKSKMVNTLEQKEHNKIKNNKKDNEAEKKKKKKKKHLSEHDDENDKDKEHGHKPAATIYDKAGTKFDMKV